MCDNAKCHSGLEIIDVNLSCTTLRGLPYSTMLYSLKIFKSKLSNVTKLTTLCDITQIRRAMLSNNLLTEHCQTCWMGTDMII